MESLNSRQQHLDPGRPSSFQSLALNNVRSASRASASFSVTSPFGNYPEPTSVNYRATMVSTTSTPTPSTQMSPFYLLREDTLTPSEANSNLLVKHGFDQTYQKSKKVKEGLSSFLPHLPGVLDELGGPENSLRSVVDKPPIGGKELLPLTGHSLSGFRLNPGPIPEQFRFMSQHPVKKKHKHKKHKSQDNERNKEGGEAVSQSGQEQEKLASSSTDKPEGAHDSKKHKKQKKHDDGERKKKKKEKKKKKRHTPDATPPGGGLDPS